MTKNTKSHNPKKRKFDSVSKQEQFHMISEAAYFLAEKRGFDSQYDLANWLNAEEEINKLINNRTK